jgi:hypothetical protein
LPKKKIFHSFLFYAPLYLFLYLRVLLSLSLSLSFALSSLPNFATTEKGRN